MDETTTTEQAPPSGQQQGAQPGPQPGVTREHLTRFTDLRRSVSDRRIAGVAGGLGRHLNIDPTILRVLFVVLVFFGGSGLLLYVAAWLLVPEEGRGPAVVNVEDSTRNALLIVAGVVAGLMLLGDSWGDLGFPWPLAVVGLAALAYVLVKDRKQSHAAQAGPAAPSGAPAGPPGPGAGWVGDPGTATTAAPSAPTTPGWVGTPSTYGPAYATGYQPGYQVTGPTYRYEPPKPSPTKRGPKLFGATLALLLVALGALGLYDATGGAVVPPAYPALALAVIGVVLVVGSFVGRAGGLILLGLMASVTLLGSTVYETVGGSAFADDRLSVAPTSADAVRADYTIRSGQAVVDLSEVGDAQELAGRTISVEGSTGELVVVLPEGVRTEVRAAISGPGAIDLPDRNAGGIGSELSGRYGEGSGLLTIDADLRVGHIDIQETR